jgi:hypothetical protein
MNRVSSFILPTSSLLLAEAAGLEPAHAMRGDLANRCHTIRRRLRKLPARFRRRSDILAEGEGVEPSRLLLGLVFKTSCAPPRATFQVVAGTPGFEPRISGLESDGLPVSLRPNESSGACGRTRTYEVVRGLIYRQVLLLLSHTCGLKFRNSHFKSQISNLRSQI